MLIRSPIVCMATGAMGWKSGCLSEMPASARGQGWPGPGQTSLAVFLDCHGRSVNALSKICGLRASSASKWVRRDAIEPDEKPAPTGKAVVREVDERWHFRKKTAQTLALEGR
jgi:hypothetical protein